MLCICCVHDPDSVGFLTSTKERSSYWGEGKHVSTHFQCERICWKWATLKRTKRERETQGRRQILVHSCFCSHKEGEVTLGERWPVSEEANMHCAAQLGECPHYTLEKKPRNHSEIGKSLLQKRTLGGDSITMSHMKKLGWFHPWK